ncbi:Protein of unknown function [Cotesia congregata]|uniref:Uncharacterized protein n=1 Tax=Cotesia congregata TaxID=51543 RepID=A0A8J2H663_COTCN|nr:Protein of unknown function [Cotesia congregata]
MPLEGSSTFQWVLQLRFPSFSVWSSDWSKIIGQRYGQLVLKYARRSSVRSGKSLQRATINAAKPKAISGLLDTNFSPCCNTACANKFLQKSTPPGSWDPGAFTIACMLTSIINIIEKYKT